jgi:CheY-like chemotaxis protein
VLIVDDSPVALAVLEAVFKGEQYDVVTAGDGMEGVEQARRTVPDLLVTDGVMPDVDGFELLRMLKEHPATRVIPVIMLTSGDIGDHRAIPCSLVGAHNRLASRM